VCDDEEGSAISRPNHFNPCVTIHVISALKIESFGNFTTIVKISTKNENIGEHGIYNFSTYFLGNSSGYIPPGTV